MWVRSLRIGSGGTKLAAIIPRSVILVSQMESAWSVLGRPGMALTCAGAIQVAVEPAGFDQKDTGFQ